VGRVSQGELVVAATMSLRTFFEGVVSMLMVAAGSWRVGLDRKFGRQWWREDKMLWCRWDKEQMGLGRLKEQREEARLRPAQGARARDKTCQALRLLASIS